MHVLIGVRREEDLKLREKTLENLKIKGAFGAQELYDKHRGKRICLMATSDDKYELFLQYLLHLVTLNLKLFTILFFGMIGLRQQE